VLWESLKHWFLYLNQVAFLNGQEAYNEFKVTCEKLKYRFFKFTQIAFWGGQREENDFPVPGDHLKHQFLELTIFEILVLSRDRN